MPYRNYGLNVDGTPSLDYDYAGGNNLGVENCRFFFDYFQYSNLTYGTYFDVGYPARLVDSPIIDGQSVPYFDRALSHQLLNWGHVKFFDGSLNNELSDLVPTSKVSQLFNLDPTIQTTIPTDVFEEELIMSIPSQIIGYSFRQKEMDYMMMLGHNAKSCEIGFKLYGGDVGGDSEPWNGVTTISDESGPFDNSFAPINLAHEQSGMYQYSLKNGWSGTWINPMSTYIGKDILLSFRKGHPPEYMQTQQSHFVMGALSMGETYLLPIDPNLDSQISFNMDGTYRQKRTLGNNVARDSNYNTPPGWSTYTDDGVNGTGKIQIIKPWTLDQEYKQFRGRRVWNINIGGIPEATMFPEHFQVLSHIADVDTDNSYPTDMYSKLIARLPNVRFMFMPNAKDPHNIAICKLDSSIEITQDTLGFYNVSFTIKEVW